MARKSSQPKTRRTGKLSLALLALLILTMGIMLQRMNGQLQKAQAEQEIYAQRLRTLQETNQSLREDIANSEDPELIADIARNELGLAQQGEKVFRFRN